MPDVAIFYPGIAFCMFQFQPEIIGIEVMEVEGEGGVIQPKLADPDIFYASEIWFFYLPAGQKKQRQRTTEKGGGEEGLHAKCLASKPMASRVFVTKKISIMLDSGILI